MGNDEFSKEELAYGSGYVDGILSCSYETEKLRADLSAAQARIAELEKAVKEARIIIEQSAPVIKDDIDAAGGCDHSVGICMCGVVSLYETIQEYLNPTMKQERERHDAEMLEAWHERL